MEAIARAVSAHLQRRSAMYLAAFSVWYFALAAAQATARPMWHDELFTAYLVRVPSAGDLWDSLESGIDLMPPLYHLIVRTLEPLIGDGPLALRLPSLVGFWVMCLCVYRYVTRRLPVEFGFAALLLPFCTHASYYMAEARPYGLLLGLAGLALVSWQALDTRTRMRPLWLACLALSLAAAIAAHYYAVLLLLPLGAGELVRSMKRRAVDWAVWTGLTAPLTVLLALLPLLRTAREFAPTFWTSPKIGEAVLVYNNWFGHSDWVFLLLAGAVVAAAVWWRRAGDDGAAALSFPAVDLVPAMALLALPAIGAFIAFATRAGFAWRYVLPGIIGFAIVGSLALARLIGHSAALRIAMLGALVLNYEVLFSSRDLLTGTTPASITSRIERRLVEQPDPATPVIVTSPHVFLELFHHAEPALSGRLRYVANPELAYRLAGTDTADRALALLAERVPVPVGRYPDGMPSSSGYYLVDVEPLNWLAGDLLAKHTPLSLVVAGEGFSIYRFRRAGDANR